MSEVTVGQAAKTAEVPVAVLRELCAIGKVPARQGERGHWYLKPENIPSRSLILEAVRAQYREDVAHAQAAMSRFTREIEAVQFDLNEAAEDLTGTARLGNDVRAVSSAGGPFNRALQALSLSLLGLELTHRSLQTVADLEPRAGDQRTQA